MMVFQNLPQSKTGRILILLEGIEQLRAVYSLGEIEKMLRAAGILTGSSKAFRSAYQRAKVSRHAPPWKISADEIMEMIAAEKNKNNAAPKAEPPLPNEETQVIERDKYAVDKDVARRALSKIFED